MKILYYPNYSNPYQGLLYSNIKKKRNITVTHMDKGFFSKHYLLFVLLFPFLLLYYRLKSYTIFHLHWQHFVFPIFNKDLKRIISTIYLIFCISLIKLLGFKLIWTIHNIVPHERLYVNDLWVTKFIINKSDYVIIHSTHTKDTLEKLNISLKKFSVIPQGTYANIYKDSISRAEARKYFKIKDSDFVILFFGQIRRYKGLDNLIKIFDEMSSKSKSLKLLVAGHCFDPQYKIELTKKLNQNPKKITYKLKYIPDDQIQYYFKAADVSIFPFKNLTNSSSAILSLTFGLPIIAPLIGNFRDFPEEVGYFFSQKQEIKETIEDVIDHHNNLKRKRNACLDYINSNSWNKSANLTYNIYKELLH